MPRPVRPILAAFALLAPPLASAAPSAAPSPYAALAATEARVAAIGFRLSTANAAWCPVRQAQFGWIWGDPRLYENDRRAEALAAYGTHDHGHAFIAAAAPGSPATKAALRVGDAVVAIGRAPVPDGEGDHPFDRITAVETQMAAQPIDVPLDFKLARGALCA